MSTASVKKPGADRLAIELHGVGVSYRRGRSVFKPQRIHALRDLDLEIVRGETLGVIGQNGCGKSTLLKVLAGIYTPDSGSIVRHSRSISLLSLGAGFDPHLPGWDNAIILGMMLGASRRQMLARLDEIVAFAELGKFIDMPLKTYSSGMRARLGFSTSLKLDTDVLLIDEVLGVGDTHFRHKAERAMRELLGSDQTIVLVSHSMTQVESVCSRVLWLHQGRRMALGDPKEVQKLYDEHVRQAEAAESKGS